MVAKFQDEFKKEAKLMGQLSHKNIVKFHGTCDSQHGKVYTYTKHAGINVLCHIIKDYTGLLTANTFRLNVIVVSLILENDLLKAKTLRLEFCICIHMLSTAIFTHYMIGHKVCMHSHYNKHIINSMIITFISL